MNWSLHLTKPWQGFKNTHSFVTVMYNLTFWLSSMEAAPLKYTCLCILWCHSTNQCDWKSSICCCFMSDQLCWFSLHVSVLLLHLYLSCHSSEPDSVKQSLIAQRYIIRITSIDYVTSPNMSNIHPLYRHQKYLSCSFHHEASSNTGMDSPCAFSPFMLSWKHFTYSFYT